jgi:hypothetical protein
MLLKQYCCRFEEVYFNEILNQVKR